MFGFEIGNLFRISMTFLYSCLRIVTKICYYTPMKIVNTSLSIQTNQQFEIINITEQVVRATTESHIKEGIVTISVPHTTAAIKLNHFEPLLLQDILRTVFRLVPQDISYNHDIFELRQNVTPNERSNGHAHVKAFLLGNSETIPVTSGVLALGDRQSVLFVECDGGRKRKVNISIVGE